MPVVSMFVETLRRHMGVLLVAALTLGVAVFVSRETRNELDLDGITAFAEYLGIAAWCLRASTPRAGWRDGQSLLQYVVFHHDRNVSDRDAAREDTLLRHQYLMAFMAVWFIEGFVIATGFSSAGPCYFDDLELGDRYKPLMDALKHSSETYPIWALKTQDILWEGFKGERPGSLGISAFPSIHVATSVLFALCYSERWKRVGVFTWIFAGIIMVGSVVLGWHYAGAILAWVIWRVVSLLRKPRVAVAVADT